MRLPPRLVLPAALSLLAALGLAGALLWGASAVSSVREAQERAAERSGVALDLSRSLAVLLVANRSEGSTPTKEVQQQLARAAHLFGPGEGSDVVEQLRRSVARLAEEREHGSAGTANQLVASQRNLLLPLERLATYTRRLDAESSRVAAAVAQTARGIALGAATLAIGIALFLGARFPLAFRAGLAATEIASRRRGAGGASACPAQGSHHDLAAGRGGTATSASQLRTLTDSREQAESWVRQRSAELERARRDLSTQLEQLEAARGQLETSGRLAAADRLARGLTHEINNPLAILLAGVEFAQEELETRARAHDAGPDEVLQALDEARQAGRRIALVVRELMSFSRERAGRDLGPTDLVEVLHHTQRLLGPEIRRHAVFTVEVAEEQVLVQGDQARLGQVFLELLRGAADAVSRRGLEGGLVSLSMRPTVKGAVVEISDNGSPIPEELRSHLFDPFYVPTPGFAIGDAGQRGTGLALASCFGIVSASGGRLEFDCGNAGTVFRVFLPLAGSQSRVALRAPSARGGQTRARLLVLESDPFDCATAYRTLSSGFDVVPHTRVPNALAALHEGGRFAAILCDSRCAWGLMQGLASASPDLLGKVVLLESTGNPEEESTAGSSGTSSLRRPVSHERVMETVRWIGEAGSG